MKNPCVTISFTGCYESFICYCLYFITVDERECFIIMIVFNNTLCSGVGDGGIISRLGGW